MQWLLANDAEELHNNRPAGGGQRDVGIFLFDPESYHLARPQRKWKLQLQRILLRPPCRKSTFASRARDFNFASRPNNGFSLQPPTAAPVALL
jgi:hypothetical protein